jgi:hypothetical protein
MTELVRAVHAWPTNSHMIEEVARLGYLDGTVLDVTHGKHGGFWKVWRPDKLTTSDLYHPADHAWDYHALPCLDREYDSVVFDPDYKLRGTPALGDMDERFGTSTKKTRDAILDQILAGARECYRVARVHLLVKCMDQVEGGHTRWQGDTVTRAIEELGGEKLDEFYLLGGGMPQPKDRTKKCPACHGRGDRTCERCVGSGQVPSEQQHAHGKPSKLLVFKKPRRR